MSSAGGITANYGHVRTSRTGVPGKSHRLDAGIWRLTRLAPSELAPGLRIALILRIVAHIAMFAYV